MDDLREVLQEELSFYDIEDFRLMTDCLSEFFGSWILEQHDFECMDLSEEVRHFKKIKNLLLLIENFRIKERKINENISQDSLSRKDITDAKLLMKEKLVGKKQENDKLDLIIDEINNN